MGLTKIPLTYYRDTIKEKSITLIEGHQYGNTIKETPKLMWDINFGIQSHGHHQSVAETPLRRSAELPLEPRGHGRAEAERTRLSLLHPDSPPRASVHCFESSDQLRRAPNEFTNPISKYRLDVILFLEVQAFNELKLLPLSSTIYDHVTLSEDVFLSHQWDFASSLLFYYVFNFITKYTKTDRDQQDFLYFETIDVHKSSELNLFTEPNVSNGTNKKQSEI
jgi:hypothetical protein